MLLAVNGTLMRGLALNGNLVAVGAAFVREAGEAVICEGRREITHHGGWRAYLAGHQGGERRP